VAPDTYRCSGTTDAILPVDQIIPPKPSVVAARGLPRVDNMRAVMAAGTALPPISVYVHAGRTFLVAGLHRYTVAREMGYTHIPVVYCSDADFPISPFSLSDYE
jgi:hypothetical protein